MKESYPVTKPHNETSEQMSEQASEQASELVSELPSERKSSQPTPPPAKQVGDKVSRMGTGSIPRLIAEFAIPSIVGMVVNGARKIVIIGIATVAVERPISPMAWPKKMESMTL